MTAFAALSLQNDAAVAKAFGPAGIDSQGVAKWLGDETVYDGRKSVTMSVKLPKNGSSVVRIKQRVSIPVMDAVDPTKRVAEAYVNIEMVLPKQASSTNCLDLRAFAKNLLGNAVTTAAVTNFESIY